MHPDRARLRAEVAVISVGGGLGSIARYGVGRAIKPAADGFPLGTLAINLVGALCLGALVVAVTEIWAVHPLIRPALGTGVLGGFTTFSTFALEARGLAFGVSSGYVAASLIGGLAGAALGMTAVRTLAGDRSPATSGAMDPIDPDQP